MTPESDETYYICGNPESKPYVVDISYDLNEAAALLAKYARISNHKFSMWIETKLPSYYIY